MSTLVEPVNSGMDVVVPPAPEQQVQQNFLPGAIKKIYLKDFLTYSKLSVDMGPKFNFIIGANGTGKSSIVCAICLGLGCSPDTLKRASKLKDFVRHGQDEAVIKLTLQGRDGDDVVIKRKFKADRVRNINNTTWFLNQKAVDEDVILKTVADLDINLDNLCNFLPQERVASFAQMSANKLMVETMRTVGGQAMVDQYDRLCSQKEVEQGLAQTLQIEQDQLTDHIQRNREMEAEVERYKEHERIKRTISMLEKKRPWIEYNHAREQFLEAKERKKELSEQIKQIKELNAPLVRKLRDCQNNIEVGNADLAEIDAILKQLTKGETQLKKKVKEATKEVSETREDLENVENQIQAHKKDLRKAKKELQHIEKQLLRCKDERSAEELTSKFKEAQKNYRNAKVACDDSENALNGAKQELGAMHARQSMFKNKINTMENEKLKKMENLRTWSPDTHKACEWLKNNRHLFKKHVYDPVLLEVSINDPRYINICESLVRQQTQLMFVCQCQSDYDLLMSELNDKQGLRVNACQFEGKVLSQYQSSCDISEIQNAGLDCFALQQFKGPEPVLVALCELTRLHNIPIGLGERIDEEKAHRLGLSFYIVGNTRYNWTTSKYGARQKTLKTSSVSHARNFNKATVDEDLLRQCKDELNSIISKIREHETAMAEFVKDFEMKKEELSAQSVIRDKLAEKRRILAKNANLKSSLTTTKLAVQQRIEELNSRPSDDELKQELTAVYHNALKKKLAIVKSLKENIQQWQDHIEVRTQICFKLWQSMLLKDQLEKEQKSGSTELAEALKRSAEMVDEVQQKKTAAQALLNAARRLGDPSDEEQQFFTTLPDDLIELDTMLADERVKAELNADTDPVIVEMYENREKRIKELTGKVDQHRQQLMALNDEMKLLRETWEPAIDQCIEGISQRFSRYFMKLGCAGEVQLRKGDQFANWGVEILVKFRDAEQLVALNSHRQSGGERAVSTIMYLISLQCFSKSPFRVVDEINQGMDPRNERLVHAQLVDTVCNEGQSQYFLITPKLLPDLQYHAGMKIHVIFNAVDLPEDKKCFID
ncbi:hypothetical protein MP228_009304 [Amoeboaphelidium protococcarum]|nr:hypothetical protein MP228_009304 [Amoeboaphelidium protococcarum]